MKIDVRSRTTEITPSIREWAERRVLFALGQFSARLRSVHVRVSDENGPKGGVDQRCLMEARFGTGGSLVAEVRDPDLYAAVSRAAERLGRRVREVIDRERSGRRSEPMPRNDRET